MLTHDKASLHEKIRASSNFTTKEYDSSSIKARIDIKNVEGLGSSYQKKANKSISVSFLIFIDSFQLVRKQQFRLEEENIGSIKG